MKCPKCDFIQSTGNLECKRCGVIFAKLAENTTPVGPIEYQETSSFTFFSPKIFLVGILLLSFGFFHFGVLGKDSPVMLGIKEARKGQTGSSGKMPQLNASPGPKLDADARRNYEAAWEAVNASDFEEAIDDFTYAIDLEPDFLEAYYNRGAAKMRLAVFALKNDDQDEALQQFRSAVDDKKRAKELMDEKRWFVYLTANDQAKVKYDVEQGLENIDEILADDDLALRALRCFLGDCR